MTHELPVKDHLRNSALYHARIEAAPGTEWKCRLLRQYAVQRQVKALLQEKGSGLKWFAGIGIPGVCIALVFAAYFGFAHPGEWMKSVIPAIGMRETFLLIAMVNGWFLVSRRRMFEGI